jgi:hypothetical protein
MILTICIFSFASLVAVDPVTEECFRTDGAGLTRAVAACSAIAKDPISTCEVQRMGATKYYIRVRRLAGSADERPATSKKEEV